MCVIKMNVNPIENCFILPLHFIVLGDLDGPPKFHELKLHVKKVGYIPANWPCRLYCMTLAC